MFKQGFVLGMRPFFSVPSTGSLREKTKWTNTPRHLPAFQTEWQWHLSQLVSELSLPTRLSPPPSPYHWLATDFNALLPSPCEMIYCAGGVILEDNILLKHTLKVDPRERSWLLHFLSLVARLILHTESLRPLWAAGTTTAPASDCSLTVCMRRVGCRGNIIPLTQGGVLRLSMLLPPLLPPSLHKHSHKCVWWLDLAALLSDFDLNPSR